MSIPVSQLFNTLNVASISSWLRGSGEPLSSLGTNGNWYYNEDNGDVYFKESGTWSKQLIGGGGSGGGGLSPDTWDVASGDLPADPVAGMMYVASSQGTYEGVRFVAGDVGLLLTDEVTMVNITKNNAFSSSSTFCTWNPSNKSINVNLTNDNLTATATSSFGVVGGTVDMTVNSMYEITVASTVTGFGLVDDASSLVNPTTGIWAFVLLSSGSTGSGTVQNGNTATPFTTSAVTFTSGAKFQCTYNPNTREVRFYLAGTRVTTSPSTILMPGSNPIRPALYALATPTIANFGATPFTNPIAGYNVGVSTTTAQFYGSLTVMGMDWNPNTGYPSNSALPGDLYYASVAGSLNGSDYYVGSGIWYDGTLWHDLQAYNPTGIPIGTMTYLGELTYPPSTTGPAYVENGVYRIVGDTFVWRDASLSTSDAKRWAPNGSTIVGINNRWQVLTTDNATYSNGRSFGYQPKLLQDPAYAGYIPQPSWTGSMGYTFEAEFIVHAYSSSYDESQFGLYQTRMDDGTIIDITTESENLWAVFFNMNTNQFVYVSSGSSVIMYSLYGNVTSGTRFTLCFNNSSGMVRVYQDGVFLFSYNVSPPATTFGLQPAGFHKSSFATYDITGVSYNTGRIPFTFVDRTIGNFNVPYPQEWVIYSLPVINPSPLLIENISLAQVASPEFDQLVSGGYTSEGYYGNLVLALTPSYSNMIGYAAMYLPFDDTYRYLHGSQNDYNGLKFVTTITGATPLPTPSCSYALNADSTQVTNEGYNAKLVTDVTEQIVQYTIQENLGGQYTAAAFPSGYLSGARIPVGGNPNPDEPVMLQFKLGKVDINSVYSDYLPEIAYGSGGYVVKIKLLNSDGSDGIVVNMSVTESFYAYVDIRDLNGTVLSNLYGTHMKLFSLLIASNGMITPYVDNIQYSPVNAGFSDDAFLVIEVVENANAQLWVPDQNTVQVSVITDQANYAPKNETPAIFFNRVRDVCLTPYNYVEYADLQKMTFASVITRSDGNIWDNDRYKQRMDFLSNYTVISGTGAPTDAITTNDGDLYVDNDTSAIYGPYTNGTWKTQLHFQTSLYPSYLYVLSNFNRTITYNFDSFYNNPIAIQPFQVTPATDTNKRSVGVKAENHTGVVSSSYVIYRLQLSDGGAVIVTAVRYGDRIVLEATGPTTGTTNQTINEPYVDGEEMMIYFATDGGFTFDCVFVAPSGTEYTYSCGAAVGTWAAYVIPLSVFDGGGSGSITTTVQTVRTTSLPVPTGYETAYWEYDTINEFVNDYTYNVPTPTIEVATVLPGHLMYRKADGIWNMIYPYYGYDRGFTVGYSVGYGNCIVTDETGAILETITQGNLSQGSFYQYSELDTGVSPPSSTIQMETDYTQQPTVYRYSRPVDAPLPDYKDGKGYLVTVAGEHHDVKFNQGDLILKGNSGNATWRIPNGIDPMYKNHVSIGNDNELAMTTEMDASTLIKQVNPGPNTITLTASPTNLSPKPGTVIRVTQTYANSPITINTNFALYGYNQNSTTVSTKNRGDTIEMVKVSFPYETFERWMVTLIQGGQFIPLATNIGTQVADYTLTADDSGGVVEMNSSSANTLTIPTDSVNLPVGSTITVTQMGTGQTTIQASGGVTILSKGGALKLTGRYSGATLYKRASNTWVLIGDITT